MLPLQRVTLERLPSGDLSEDSDSTGGDEAEGGRPEDDAWLRAISPLLQGRLVAAGQVVAFSWVPAPENDGTEVLRFAGAFDSAHRPPLLDDDARLFFVVETTPLLRGRVDGSTALLLADSLISPHQHHLQQHHAEIFSSSSSSLSSPSISSLVSPFSALSLSTSSLPSDAILSPTAAQVESGLLRVAALPYPLPSPQPAPRSREVATEAGLSLRQLRRLGLFSGDWVLLRPHDPSLPSAAVRVFATDPPEDGCQSPTHVCVTQRFARRRLLPATGLQMGEEQVLLSPQALFNAGWDLLLAARAPVWVGVRRLSMGSDRCQLLVSPPLQKPAGALAVHEQHEGLPVATSVTVARVSSASVVRVTAYQRALIDYFAKPRDQWRVLSPGYVIKLVIPHIFASSGREEQDGDEENAEEEEKEAENLTCNDEQLIIDDLIMDDGSEQAVFYVVTDVEYPQHPPHLHQNQNQQAAGHSLEQLVWVPPTARILQTAPVQTRVFPVLEYPLPGTLEGVARQLVQLLSPCFLPIAKKLGIRVPVLVHGPPACGKQSVVRRAAGLLGVHVFDVNCLELLQESEQGTIPALETIFQVSADHTPCLILLRNVSSLESNRSASSPSGLDPQVARVLRELISRLPTGTENLISLVATCDSKALEDSSATLRSCFTHTLSVAVPDLPQRLGMLREIFCAAGVTCALDVDLQHLASNTASFCLGDLASLVSRALEAAQAQLDRHIGHPANGLKASTSNWGRQRTAGEGELVLSAAHFESALGQMRKHPSRTAIIGTPNIPSVRWADVGGLESVKQEILDTIQLPIQCPELFAAGLRQRSGVLLYGPPGCGKTLIAKAVATECSLNFLSVKGPELINMYVGESERNVREVFARARAANPCIIFFDEMDSLAPNRGKASDSGGVMDRIVSQLLAELDGMTASPGVFIIGATNRPDLLDPALLRPGRFDRIVYLGVPSQPDGQEQVLGALTRKFPLDPSVDIPRLVASAPPTLSGADLYALCSDAYLNAIKARISSPQSGPLLVTADHFAAALASLRPSLSLSELAEYASLRQKARLQ